jgi:FkbM family methyltransferase
MDNSIEIKKWLEDRGDYTHNLTYDLNGDSIIIDLGGYTGAWAEQIIKKYNPNVYIIEPVTEFYETMVSKFSNNSKVRLMNVAAGIENKYGTIFLQGDGTSSNLNTGESIKVEFNTIDTILEKWGLDEVDLMQINIEGDEYPVLEHMLKIGSINKFKNIQIQFHFIGDYATRRDKIREGLIKNGFKNKFDYPFVWESWYK